LSGGAIFTLSPIVTSDVFPTENTPIASQAIREFHFGGNVLLTSDNIVLIGSSCQLHRLEATLSGFWGVRIFQDAQTETELSFVVGGEENFDIDNATGRILRRDYPLAIFSCVFIWLWVGCGVYISAYSTFASISGMLYSSTSAVVLIVVVICRG
jgi:hypothetical protein